MKCFIFFVVIALVAGCRAQPLTYQGLLPYAGQTRAFLAWYLNEYPKGEYPNPGFVLVDTAAGPYFEEFVDIDTDSADFTTAERAEISAELKKPRFAVWKSEQIPQARIVSRYSLEPGETHSEFGAPIFLRNNTLCLFYSSDFAVWALSGKGSLTLYRRAGKGWERVRDFGSWGRLTDN